MIRGDLQDGAGHFEDLIKILGGFDFNRGLGGDVGEQTQQRNGNSGQDSNEFRHGGYLLDCGYILSDESDAKLFPQKLDFFIRF